MDALLLCILSLLSGAFGSESSHKDPVKPGVDDEIPVLNLKRYDPSMISVCDELLSADDIYTAVMAVHKRVEDGLRSNNCFPDRYGIHPTPITVQSLFGPIKRLSSDEFKEHPLLGAHVRKMISTAQKVIRYADKCYYDHTLMMDLMRMAMKLLVNRISCTELSLDIARNRYGWPSKFGDGTAPPDPAAESAGMGMGAVNVGSRNVKDPNDEGNIPYTRWSGPFAKVPQEWPWNGWPWRANIDPPTLQATDRITGGSSAGYKVPTAL